ncbi:MAG: type II toxin-antitoxin system VapC family toxin [Bdellovibrionota bacterium]
MLLVDVNILLYSHRQILADHVLVNRWLVHAMAGSEPVALCDFVATGFVRIATSSAVFIPPSSPDTTFDFIEELRKQPNYRWVTSGPDFWDIFVRLCRESGISGSDISDAYLAALAIENGCTLVSMDRGFRRFRGLKWKLPK